MIPVSLRNQQCEHHCHSLWRCVTCNVRVQVRAAATMGGNLVLAKEQGLQSDVATLMSALQAQVGITSVDREDLRYVGATYYSCPSPHPFMTLHDCSHLRGIAPHSKPSSLVCSDTALFASLVGVTRLEQVHSAATQPHSCEARQAESNRHQACLLSFLYSQTSVSMDHPRERCGSSQCSKL